MREQTKSSGWSSLAISACSAGLIVAGCSGSSGSKGITIPAARTFKLADFSPARTVPNRATTVSFRVDQPSGKPLTPSGYRRGAGPHTGVHLIIVKSDLSTIIHDHPPVGANGRLDQSLVFPSPGRYRVIVDLYPKGPQRNFQLFTWIRVAGAAKAHPLPQYNPSVTVDGYRFTIRGKPHLKAIEASLMTVTVTDPSGRPARFTPWFGALAHAIFFHAGSLDYFHTHVCAPGATGCTSIFAGKSVTGSSATPGKLNVGVLLPLPGTWRLFLQCRVSGHVLTAPFTLHVS